MAKNTFLKRLLLVVMLVTLALQFVPAGLAQDAEATPAAEVGGEEGGEGAAEEAGLLTPLGINSGLLFVQLFNFLLIAFVLGMVLWRPAVNFLDARAAKIQKGLEDAAAAAKARQNAEQDADKILAEARAEAAKIVAEARASGEKLAKDEEARGRQAADKIRSDAQTEASAAKAAELSGLRDQVINISTALAGRIINANLDAKKQADLVSDFFSKVPDAAKALSGKVEVVSAMPLNDTEQSKVKSAIGASEVEFKVEPGILGGLVVRSADKIIDGSVKSGLADLAARLN